MMRKVLGAASGVCFALFCAVAAGAQAKPASIISPGWGPKEIGVLLLGPGPSHAWSLLVENAQKALGPSCPVFDLAGSLGPRDLQHAINSLQDMHVRKIIAVPMYLFSQDAQLDQIRYILGITKYPSRAFMKGSSMTQQTVSRVRAKVPLVMSPALDDHPLVAQILRNLARDLSRQPSRETLVFIGEGSLDDGENNFRQKIADSLAQSITRQERFDSVRGVLLRPNSKSLASRNDLRHFVAQASRKGRVLVIPYFLDAGGSGRSIRRALEGLFYQSKDKGLMVDARMTDWVKQTVEAHAEKETMVQFKDAGQGLPAPERKRIVQ